VAAPVLAQFMPLSSVIPLLAVMDMLASVKNIWKNTSSVQFKELKRLIPMMFLGSVVGAYVLLHSEPERLLLAMGVFVVVYAVYSLSGVRINKIYKAIAAYPFGVCGGVFSALFGSGGFIYAIYLSGRMDDIKKIRSTQIALIFSSTATRCVLFLVAGVYSDPSIFWMGVFLLPAMLLGVSLGNKLTLTMDKSQFVKIINSMVLVAGIVLIVRYITL